MCTEVLRVGILCEMTKNRLPRNEGAFAKVDCLHAQIVTVSTEVN